MSKDDRAAWRKHAEECVNLARITTDPQAKQLLLTRAQEWLKLAYSNSDAEFQRILLAFNKEQMAVNKEHIAVAAKAPPGTQRTAVQQQPAQQQQSKIQPDENGSCEQ